MHVHSLFTGNFILDHAQKMHELPDEYLADALPVAKKIALAVGAENYNILQVITSSHLSPLYIPYLINTTE